MRRIVRPEILDTNNASPEDVRDSLVDLQRINRWFGGISTTAKLLKTIAQRSGKTELSLLDVASATGDVPKAVQQKLRKRVAISYTLLDRNIAHFDSNHHVNRVRGDALALPFRDNSFDVVTCALFTHHLAPYQVAMFAKEAVRVSRIALLINDLRRSYLHLASVYAGLPFFRRITRHDSVASVWNAYTISEMRDVLRHVRHSGITINSSYFFRMGVLVWKRDTT
jgi:hypothetical protein